MYKLPIIKLFFPFEDIVCEKFGSNCMRCGTAPYPENVNEPTRIGATTTSTPEACSKYCSLIGASCCHYKSCKDGNCFCGAYSDNEPNVTPKCGVEAKKKYASKCSSTKD